MSSRLGRGLEALITGAESTDRTTGITTVLVDHIQPNPYQPRKNFDPEKLRDLADSLTESGMIQPIIVTKKADSEYELIAGERRLEAAKLAGFTEVPVIIRSVSKKEQLQYAIIENIQRENLNPLEEAEAYNQLHKEFSLTHDEIAKLMGKERTTITNSLRLLKLSGPVRKMLLAQRLSQGHARTLIQLEGEKQLEFALLIENKQLSVRDTEQVVKSYLETEKKSGKSPEGKTVKSYKERQMELEKKIRDYINLKVRASGDSNKGRISIYYESNHELKRLLEVLKNYE